MHVSEEVMEARNYNRAPVENRHDLPEVFIYTYTVYKTGD
jgi:hypothetical protein